MGEIIISEGFKNCDTGITIANLISSSSTFKNTNIINKKKKRRRDIDPSLLASASGLMDRVTFFEVCRRSLRENRSFGSNQRFEFRVIDPISERTFRNIVESTLKYINVNLVRAKTP